jgi:hypothetical protein
LPFFSLNITLFSHFSCVLQDTTGACVNRVPEEGASWCMEDEPEAYCEGHFAANASCSSLGYSYFCTMEDMLASVGKNAYFTSRYLNNPQCDPNAGGGPGTRIPTLPPSLLAIQYRTRPPDRALASVQPPEMPVIHPPSAL